MLLFTFKVVCSSVETREFHLTNRLDKCPMTAKPSDYHPTRTTQQASTRYQAIRLVQALGGGHGSLDGQASNVLPALLEEGDEVVDGKHDVGNELLSVHADVADGDTHAQNLLELELDGGLDLGDLAAEVVGVRDRGGELAGWGVVST